MKKRHSGIQEEKHTIVDMPTQKQLEQMIENTEQQFTTMWL
jgi:hypothetical protein